MPASKTKSYVSLPRTSLQSVGEDRGREPPLAAAGSATEDVRLRVGVNRGPGRRTQLQKNASCSALELFELDRHDGLTKHAFDSHTIIAPYIHSALYPG